MQRTIHILATACAALGVSIAAHAGPAMYNASFIWHAWGNDVTTGSVSPYNTSTFLAAPIGYDCQDASPYSVYGLPNTRYCSPTLRQMGKPATGSGTLSLGSGSPATIVMPVSAFGITTTGFNATYYPYLQSHTFATIHNDAGSFFAGGGPAAGLGQKVKTGMGQRAGTWIINEGPNAFGGALGLLGRFGADVKYVVPGVAGTYINKSSDWDMVQPIGRVPYATPTAYSPMGKTTNWLNPHELTGMGTNNYNGKVSSFVVRGSGTPWTTGSVTLYATAGIFTTILHRAGYDTQTSNGARNIQLVTPTLTHWIGPGFQTHTGQMGILKLQLAPEPQAGLLLMAGGALLALLYRMHRGR